MNLEITSARHVLCELPDTGLPGVENWSPFCVKAHRALSLAGVAYERRVGFPASFKKYNPAAQVPVLLADDRPIADSTEILRYLIAGGARLEPKSPSACADAWLFEELGDTALNGFLVASRWADDETWPAVSAAYFKGMPAPVRWIVPGRLRAGVLKNLHARDVLRRGLDAAKGKYEILLDRLEARAPASGYWMGDSITVADLGLFPQLMGTRTGLSPKWAARVEARPRLTAWLDRVQATTRLDRVSLRSVA